MDKRIFAFILLVILILVLSALFDKWWFGVVVESDLPDWLKYSLLKG